MVPPGAPPALEVASRTDRGVHARANALSLESPLAAHPLLRALNGIDPAIFFTAARPIPPSFSVRTPRRRWYRYFEPREGRDLQRWREAAERFLGFVDARSFARDLGDRLPMWRRLESVTVGVRGRVLLIDLKAPSFERGMVRKIVGALRAHDMGRLTLESLDASIRGERRLTLPLAEPERLVLWEVQYDEPWTYVPPPGSAGQARRDRAAREAAVVREAVDKALTGPARRTSERTASGQLK